MQRGGGDEDPGRAPGTVTPFRSDRYPSYVEMGALPAGVAARIIRAYGEVEIQVSCAVAPANRRDAGRHVIESHYDICASEDCLAARGWLRNPHLLRVVASVSA